MTVNIENLHLKDTHREKNTLKSNSSDYEKYEYKDLENYYIKSNL